MTSDPKPKAIERLALRVSVRIAGIICLILSVLALLTFISSLPFYFWGLPEVLPAYPMVTIIALLIAAIFAFLFAVCHTCLKRTSGEQFAAALKSNFRSSMKWFALTAVGPSILLIYCLIVVCDDLRWGLYSAKACSSLSNGRYDEASDRFAELIPMSSEPTRLAVVEIMRGYTLSQAHRYKDAVSQFREAIALTKSDKGKNRILLADADLLLAEAFNGEKDFNGAEQALQEAIATIEEADKLNERTTELHALKFIGAPINLPSLDEARVKLIKIYLKEGKAQEAESLCQQLLNDPKTKSNEKTLAEANRLHAEALKKLSPPEKPEQEVKRSNDS